MEGESVVEFEILSDGSEREPSVKLKKSSGRKILDKQAIETILEIASSDPPPKSDMKIIFPVEFKLKR